MIPTLSTGHSNVLYCMRVLYSYCSSPFPFPRQPFRVPLDPIASCEITSGDIRLGRFYTCLCTVPYRTVGTVQYFLL